MNTNSRSGKAKSQGQEFGDGAHHAARRPGIGFTEIEQVCSFRAATRSGIGKRPGSRSRSSPWALHESTAARLEF